MSGWHRFRYRVVALFHRRRFEREMAEEMAFHLQQRAAENAEDGLPPEAALQAAQHKFGNAAVLAERARDEVRFLWLEQAAQDLRYGVRMLRKHPGFTAIIVATLALGIGATTALFNVVHAVVLRPLPYPESHRLVRLAECWRGEEAASVSYPNFIDWRRQQTVFAQLGAYRLRSYALSGDAEPIQVSAGEVSREALQALQAQPALGRLFDAKEDAPGGEAVVLLGHALWRDRFAAAPDIIGRRVTLDGRSYTVIGVMPLGFSFPRGAAIWVALGRIAVGSDWESRGAHSGLYGLGRLKPGVALSDAQSELDVIGARLAAQYREVNSGHGVQVTSLHAAMIAGADRTLWPLFGATALVLLIACANVANLLLARAITRHKEIAVRAALGAGRRRIIRQLLVESLLLALLGGAGGLLLAYVGRDALLGFVAASIPDAADARFGGAVSTFFVAVILLAAFGFGLAPACAASRVDVQDALQSSSRGVAGRGGKVRRGLVVAELALTVLLLVGAGLLVRSLVQLQRVEPGFAIERGLTFRVDLSATKYPTLAQRADFFRTLVERLRSLPGVTAASVTSRVPLNEQNWDNEFLIDGRPEPPPGSRPTAEMQRVDPEYFHTMGIPLLRGRAFTEGDDRRQVRGTARENEPEAGLNVVIIDEEFARRVWPGEDPIGQRIRFPWSDARETQPVATVVGVVRHVKLDRLAERNDALQAYVPVAQMPRTRLNIVLRTAADPRAIVSAVRAQVTALDPAQPIHDIHTFDELRQKSGSSQRLSGFLLGAFALVALSLALVGLYGVLSFLVAQRQREIGVRLALGANTRDVLRLILGEGLMLSVLGVALGLLGAVGFARLLRHLLFEVQTVDPLTFVAVPVILLAMTLLACWVPARRAAKVDPLIALRAE